MHVYHSSQVSPLMFVIFPLHRLRPDCVSFFSRLCDAWSSSSQPPTSCRSVRFFSDGSHGKMAGRSFEYISQEPTTQLKHAERLPRYLPSLECNLHIGYLPTIRIKGESWTAPWGHESLVVKRNYSDCHFILRSMKGRPFATITVDGVLSPLFSPFSLSFTAFVASNWCERWQRSTPAQPANAFLVLRLLKEVQKGGKMPLLWDYIFGTP